MHCSRTCLQQRSSWSRSRSYTARSTRCESRPRPERNHEMSETRRPEPWLRGTHAETPSVQKAVLHALELADEDLEKWCGNLSDEQINARPSGLAPVAFHI